jgi:outer membrane protein OmpA-like peptidoglycan-associated protein
MQNNGDLSIEIEGHTDNVGSQEHNLTLSENRAKEVYSFLVDKGIAATRMTYKGFGDSKPIASNDSETGRAENRRTAFRIK